jgi:hypothetical protein
VIENKQTRNLFLLAILCFSVSGLILIFWLGNIEINTLLNSRVQWGILLMGIFLGALTILWARRRGKIDIFEFPTWTSLNLYVQAVLSVVFFYNRIEQIYPSLRNNYNYWLYQAILLLCIGLGSIWIGYSFVIYYLIKKNDKPKKITRTLNLRLAVIIWILLWLFMTYSTFANFLGWGGTAIGVWSNYLAFVQILYLAASAALLLHHFRNPTTLGWVWMTIALFFAVINGISIGTRAVVFYFIYIFILAYYATGKYKWRWLIIGAIAMVILVPSASLIRDQIPRFRAVRSQERLNSTINSINEVIEEPIVQLITQVVELFSTRQGGLFLITASSMRIHSGGNSYVGSDMLDEFLIGLIPRVVWRSKPAGQLDLYRISTTYADAPSETSFSDIGLIADAFRAGGWFFVIFIFILLGGFMGWIYWKGPLLKNDEWIVFYFLLLTIITYSRPILEIGLFLFQRAILLGIFIIFFLYKRIPVTNSNLARH